jgi:hypothetical protein
MKPIRKLKHAWLAALVAAILGLILLPVSSASATGQNDWLETTLRTDLSSVYSSTGFGVQIYAYALPDSNADFTSGWIGLYLDSLNTGFAQVGLITYAGGVEWFVYATPSSGASTTCLQGSSAFGTRGCVGGFGNCGVSLNTWQTVSIVYPGTGYWVARLKNGTCSVDLAKINDTSTRVYRATEDGEESWDTAYDNGDPHRTMSFFHYHPLYWAGSSYQDWPAGSGGASNVTNNHLDSIGTAGTSFCSAYYGAVPNELGDARYWFTGSGGTTCTISNLF